MPRFPSATVDLTGYSKIGSGSYPGDSMTNRAIPHGLGVVPKIIQFDNGNYINISFLNPEGSSILYQDDAVTYQYSITPPDATNFYVGNASNYNASQNVTGSTHTWRALG